MKSKKGTPSQKGPDNPDLFVGEIKKLKQTIASLVRQVEQFKLAARQDARQMRQMAQDIQMKDHKISQLQKQLTEMATNLKKLGRRPKGEDFGDF